MALWKNGVAADDLWRAMPEDGYVSNGVPTILPLKAWLEQRDALLGRDQMFGVRIEPGEALQRIGDAGQQGFHEIPVGLTGQGAKLWSARNNDKPGPAMLISPAYAQDMGGAMGAVTQFLPLILIFGVFYFLLIRPQQQRAKQMKAMLAALRRGDRVVTAGGILATVQKVKDGSDEIEVDLAPNVRVTVLRDTITSVLKPVVANDTKPA